MERIQTLRRILRMAQQTKKAASDHQHIRFPFKENIWQEGTLFTDVPLFGIAEFCREYYGNSLS